MAWQSVTASSETWTGDTATSKAWGGQRPSQMPWLQPRASAASADGGQDFQFQFRQIGANTFVTDRPFLLTESTLSEGQP